MAEAVSIPKPKKITDFQAVESWIWAEHDAAEASMPTGEALEPQSPVPYYQPRNVLKRLVYRHVKSLLARGKLDQLKSYLRRRDGAAAWAENDNPFVWGFRLIWGPEVDRAYIRWRSKYAIELMYSHRHRIRWENLDFFLAFAGSHDEIQRKAGASKMPSEAWADSLREPK